MADLIERDAAIRMLCDYAETKQDLDYYSDMLIKIPAVERWIPCSDRLPKQSGIYLAYFTFKDGTHAIDITYINTGCHLGSITHWMPLPEPPKEYENENR